MCVFFFGSFCSMCSSFFFIHFSQKDVRTRKGDVHRTRLERERESSALCLCRKERVDSDCTRGVLTSRVKRHEYASVTLSLSTLSLSRDVVSPAVRNPFGHFATRGASRGGRGARATYPPTYTVPRFCVSLSVRNSVVSSASCSNFGERFRRTKGACPVRLSRTLSHIVYPKPRHQSTPTLKTHDVESSIANAWLE